MITGSEKEIEEEWEKVARRIGYERRGESKRQHSLEECQ